MIDKLRALPIEDTPDIETARKNGGPTVLGLVLAEAGCSHEASALLRGTRAEWSRGPDAPVAKAALAETTWWNATWRELAQAMQAGQNTAALEVIGDRVPRNWDRPALLLHRAAIARDARQAELAAHLLRRVAYLAERGLPNLEMSAFAYVARSGLIDILADAGDVEAALAEYAEVVPNTGNAMAHEIQGVRLLAMAGRNDDAMRAVAAMLITAREGRHGYSKDIRLDFVDRAPELDALRQRPDWAVLLDDPKAWGR
ncbi:MAG: hypothetical protein AAFR35_05610 [Pseudomonadota bacterium]